MKRVALDGLILAIDMLNTHCRQLKYEKKIYYFSFMPSTAGPVSDDDETLVSNMKEQNIALNLMSVFLFDLLSSMDVDMIRHKRSEQGRYIPMGDLSF